MKILYYSSHHGLNLNAPAGYATHMRETINAMRKLGHEVEVLINGGTEWDVENRQIPSSNIKSKLKKIAPKILWETAKDRQLRKNDENSIQELAAAVKNFQPDIIYERYNYFQDSGFQVAKKYDVKHILEVNSPYIEERIELQGKSLFLSQAKKMEAKIFKGCDKLVVVSSALKQHFIDEYQLDGGKVQVLPNAISKEWLENALQQKPFNQEIFVFGFVGSLFPWHGVDLLVKAFSEFQNEYPNSKLQIVGDGEILADLILLADELGVKSKVTFVGSVPHKEVPKLIQSFDVAIMAKSNWYGSPVKIFEYGALGIPVIAPNNIPVRDVMTNEQDGYLIEPTINDLCNAMKAMYLNPKKRQEMAEEFKSKVLKNHTWEENVMRTLTEM